MKGNIKNAAIALTLLPASNHAFSGILYEDLDPDVTSANDNVLLKNIFPSLASVLGEDGFSLTQGQLPNDGSVADPPTSGEFGLIEGILDIVFQNPTADQSGASFGPGYLEPDAKDSFTAVELIAGSTSNLSDQRDVGFVVTRGSDEYFGWLSYQFRNDGPVPPATSISEDGGLLYATPVIDEIAIEDTANTGITVGAGRPTPNVVSEPLTLPLVAAGIAGVAAARNRRQKASSAKTAVA